MTSQPGQPAALSPQPAPSTTATPLQGQALVSPTAAQIAFCSVPLWSALLAAAALPGEAVGPLTLVGGAVVAAAGLVAVAPAGEPKEPKSS